MFDHLESVVGFLKQTNNYKLAEQMLDVFLKQSKHIQEYDILGKLYQSIKSYEKSLICIKHCEQLSTKPEEKYSIRANAAKIYNHLNLPKESLKQTSENLQNNPYDFNMLLEQVFSFYLLGEKDKSEALLRQLLEINSLPPEIRNRVLFNLGTYDIRAGKFLEGFYKFYVIGKKVGIWPPIHSPFKEWLGNLIPNQTIVIYAEGGIGDEIVNVRFMKNIKAMGMNPLWFTSKKDIRGLFSRCGFGTIEKSEDAPKESLFCPSMSLPLLLQLSPEQLWTEPYLFPDPEKIKEWSWVKSYFYKPKELKQIIGIRWFGNPLYDQDLHRTIPLDDLLSILIEYYEENPNTLFVSLQQEMFSQKVFGDLPVLQVGERLKTFDDTLAVISFCDLVITSCTSIVHASSAMGKKTIVMVPISTYYIWETADLNQKHSPWYAETTTVLRQREYDNWNYPLEELREQLNRND